MNIAECFQILELSAQANLKEVKASYRRLARQYHPDTNPSDRSAQDKFIRVNEAYKVLLNVLAPEAGAVTKPNNSTAKSAPKVKVTTKPSPAAPPTAQPSTQPASTPASSEVNFQASSKSAPAAAPSTTPLEQQLKRNSYKQLQEFLKEQRFPRATALVEALAQRLPQDPEIRQWQAITYQCWGRHLIQAKQAEKARIYLRKALRTDPHNKTLWAEVEKDFSRLERII